MKKACFIFNFDSTEEARVIASSLDPEIKNKIPKTNVKVLLEKEVKVPISIISIGPGRNETIEI